MFKKLRDKITEEVKQSAERLPVNIQQFAQFSQSTEEQGGTTAKMKDDQLLVDISDIKPAGYNTDLFSIDEDNESSPSKGEFHVIELNSEACAPSKETAVLPTSPLETNFPGTPTGTSGRYRRNSGSSSVSDASSFFPIYEAPALSSSLLHSDLESCASEWDESSTVDRLNNDAVYQAYLRMRQRYQKYKGRYADVARVCKENEKEMQKMKEVLAKTQDKSVRRMSELREQCVLEQQAKAHLEQELRSDLEEKDHKIAALLTKVKLIQEGYLDELKPQPLLTVGSAEVEKPSPAPSLSNFTSQGESVENQWTPGDGDDLSIASFGSVSTAPTSLETDELIERLKGDVAKHKSLLARCFENIRNNKKKVTQLSREKQEASDNLQQQLKVIEILKTEHAKELESLRSAIESSALSMAETKQQFFNELQSKETEVHHYKTQLSQLEEQQRNAQQNASVESENCDDETQKSDMLEDIQEKSDVMIAEELDGDQREQQMDEVLAGRDAAIAELKKVNETLDQKELLLVEQEAKLQDVVSLKEKLEAKVQEMENSNAELQTRNEILKQEVETSTQQVEETSQNMQKILNDKNELETRLSDEKNATAQQMADLRESLHRSSNQQIQSLEEQLESLRTNIKEKTDSIKCHQENIDQHTSTIEELSSTNAELRNTCQKYETDAKGAVSENQLLKKKCNTLEENLRLQQEQCVGDRQKVQELEAQNKKLLEGNSQLLETQEHLSQMTEKLTSLQKELYISNTQITEYKSANAQLINTVSQSTEKLDDVKSKLEEKLQDLQSQHEVLKVQNEKLLEEKTAFSSTQNEVVGKNEDLMKSVEFVQSQLEKQKADHQDLHENHEKLLKENENLLNIKNDLESLNQQLTASNDLLQKKLDELKASYDEQVINFNDKLDKLATKNQDLVASKSSIELNLEQLVKTNNQLESEASRLQAESKINTESQQNEITSLTESKARLQEENLSLNSELSGLTLKIDDLTKNTLELEEKLKLSQKELTDCKLSYESKLNEVNNLNETLQKENIDLKTKSAETTEMENNNAKNAEKMQQLEADLASQQETSQKEISRMNLLVKQLEEDKASLTTLSSKTNSDYEEISKVKSELASQVLELQAKESEYQRELDEAHERHNDLSRKLEENGNIKSELVSLKSERTQLMYLKDQLQENCDSMKEQLSRLTNELSEKSDIQSNLEATLQSLKESSAKTEKALTNLSSEYDNLKNKASSDLAKHESLETVANGYKQKINELEKLISENKKNEDIVNQLKEENQQYQVEGERLNNQLKETVSILEDEKKLRETSTANLNSKSKEIEDLQRQCTELKAEIEKKKNLEESAKSNEVTFTQEELEQRLTLVKTEAHNHFERTIENIKNDHNAEIRELTHKWENETEARLAGQEEQLSHKLERVTEEWQHERKEVERLTQVAASAFESGTNSMDLLKKQVAAQRKEIEQLRNQQRKDNGDTKNSVKRHHNMHSSNIEDIVPQFEYLKNILFQYMIGRETQTLSKVLCDVVKFDTDQKQQIAQYEEGAASLITTLTGKSRKT